jgi:hypothetical protein
MAWKRLFRKAVFDQTPHPAAPFRIALVFFYSEYALDILEFLFIININL